MVRFVSVVPLAAAGLLAMAPFVSTASATTAPGDAVKSTAQQLAELPPEYEEMLADFQAEVPGVSPEEALARLRGQDARIRLLESLGESIPESFGGSWYDRKTGIQHLVITSEPAEKAARASAERHAVASVIHRGRFSYKELEAAARNVKADPASTLGETGVEPVVDVDIPRNRVTVSLPEPALSRARARGLDARLTVVAASRNSGKFVDEACTSRAACGSPLRSGVIIHRPGTIDCSVGFRARATDGSYWVLGAGHCGELNEMWSHGVSAPQYFGPVRQRTVTFFGTDVARAHLQNGYWIGGGGGWQYNARATDSPTPINGAITSHTTIQAGDYVCLNAQFSTIGNSCGAIQGSSNGFPRVTFDACNGDSGGAWIHKSASGFTWAYGVHKGQDGPVLTCHVEGEASIFSSLPHINNYFDSNSAATIRVETR